MKVVFLDRDGVINTDSPYYVKSCEELVFIPGSLEAIALLSQKGYKLIVITNQSVIGRKMVDEPTLESMHRKIRDAAEEAGGRIEKFYYCPHLPEDACECRKPKPGLIHQARDEYRIDLSVSCMIGDSGKDMEAAQEAGCGMRILVRTGNGQKTEARMKEENNAPDHVAENLLEAARYIIASMDR